MRTKPTKCHCLNCDRDFESLTCSPKDPQKYCSRKCFAEARTSKVVLHCTNCNARLERKKYWAALSQKRGHFCGHKCHGEWQKQLAGPGHPRYKARSNSRGAAQLVRAKQLVLERDGSCQVCGTTEKLHVHHIQHWKPGQVNPHDVDNLTTLCASCHRKQHPVPRGPNGRFVSMAA